MAFSITWLAAVFHVRSLAFIQAFYVNIRWECVTKGSNTAVFALTSRGNFTGWVPKRKWSLSTSSWNTSRLKKKIKKRKKHFDTSRHILVLSQYLKTTSSDGEGRLRESTPACVGLYKSQCGDTYVFNFLKELKLPSLPPTIPFPHSLYAGVWGATNMQEMKASKYLTVTTTQNITQSPQRSCC